MIEVSRIMHCADIMIKIMSSLSLAVYNRLKLGTESKGNWRRRVWHSRWQTWRTPLQRTLWILKICVGWKGQLLGKKINLGFLNGQIMSGLDCVDLKMCGSWDNIWDKSCALHLLFIGVCSLPLLKRGYEQEVWSILDSQWACLTAGFPLGLF